MKLVSLEEQYKYYLNNFKNKGINPHPSELLALLLLPDKDKYLSLTGNIDDFYNYYQDEIDKRIIQVMNDFDLEEEDIIEYANIFEERDNFDYKKNVFANGIIVLQWGIMYHLDWSPERIYEAFSICWRPKNIENHLMSDTEEKLNVKRKKITISTATTGFKF